MTPEPALAGIGIDAVLLSRLARRSDERGWLFRFARAFTCAAEYAAIEAACGSETEDELRVHVAAHFALMEAASKAAGTGLRLGLGMGKPQSLPVRSIGALRVQPQVELYAHGAAQERIRELGVSRMEGHWAGDSEFLTAVVLLWK